jgi:hypothetical protein
MKTTRLLLPILVALATALAARSADLAGKWHADFDSPIGAQKYDYVFTQSGAELAGKATFENPMAKGESPLKDIKVTGNTVTFTELAKFNDNELTITYTGTLEGDELKLSRKVGDYGTEELVAKRSAPPATK